MNGHITASLNVSPLVAARMNRVTIKKAAVILFIFRYSGPSIRKR